MSCLYPPYPPYRLGRAFRGPGLEDIERKSIESGSDSGVDVASLSSGESKVNHSNYAVPDKLPSIPRHQMSAGEPSQTKTVVEASVSMDKNGRVAEGNLSRSLRQRRGIQTCKPSQQGSLYLPHILSRGNSLRIHIFHEGNFPVPHEECHTTHTVTVGTRAVDLFRFHNLKGGPQPNRRLTLHQLGWYVRVHGNARRWVAAEHESTPIRWDVSDMRSIWESDWLMVGREAWLTCRCDFDCRSFKVVVGKYGG